tara:strand:- start:427 stop:1392 length:966 start_codon:yes stop_codon:yes gene_type:complete
MNDFRDDPWEHINEPIYPEVQRLFRKDDRFWVSVNEKNEKLFVINVPIQINEEIPINLNVIEVDIVEFDAGNTRFLCILKDDNLLEIFTLMVKDIAYTCINYSDVEVINKAMDRLFTEWLQLLKPSHAGIGMSKLIGLWGELFILNEKIKQAYPISEAINFWIGPDDKKQDFTVNRIALEVKTTIAGSNPSIKITSLEQLEKITDKLYLVQLFINQASSGDEDSMSLDDIYEQVWSSIHENDPNTKTNFMLKAGKILNKAKKSEKNLKFLYQSYDLYDVNNLFPSISSSDLPDPIRNVKYDIDTSKIRHLLSSETIEEILK